MAEERALAQPRGKFMQQCMECNVFVTYLALLVFPGPVLVCPFP